jgi:hypothetical protein
MMGYCQFCGQWHALDSAWCPNVTPCPAGSYTVLDQMPAPPPDPTPALWEIAAQLRRIADALEAGK